MEKKQEKEIKEENNEDQENEEEITDNNNELYNEINKKSKKERIKELFSNILRIISPSKIKAGRRRLQHMIDAAGLPLTAEQIGKAIISTDVALSLSLTAFEIYFFRTKGAVSYVDISVYVVVMWIISFVLFLIMLWMGFFIYLDMRKVKIKKELKKLHEVAEQKRAHHEVKPILWRFSFAEKYVNLFKSIIRKEKKKETSDEEDLEKIKSIKPYFTKKFTKEEKKIHKHERIRHLQDYFEKAGFNFDFNYISRNIFKIVIFLMCVVTSYELIYFSLHGTESISYVLAIAAIIWVPVFAITWILLWVAFVIYLDIRIFKRRLEVEKVLPDFLQLTSANIRAGMTIDRALWFAVRPRFGILANEIEEVAKRTLSGDPLDDGLKGFSNKYDSVLLNKSVNILIEGIRAGGNVGDLLNKIAINIQEMTSLKKEMGANVTTYVIFIGFASIVAAPVLFALSNHLLIVVDTITSNLDVASSSGTGLSISTEGGIDIGEYKWFSRISLLLTAFFSSIIIGTIMKGNIKETAHYVPIFILSSQVIYIVAYYILKVMLSGFFG